MNPHDGKPAQGPASPATPPSSAPLETLIAQRREKLARLREQKNLAYPYSFHRSHRIADVLKEFAGELPGHGSDKAIRLAGRLMTVRDMGKTCFATLADGPDRMQIYV